MRPIPAVTAALLCAAATTCIFADETNDAARQANLKIVRETYEQNLATYWNNPDILVMSGLVADRSNKLVRIQAEATGMKHHLQTEFMLIAENSGHDYEALAVSFAKPSSIHRALEFIGMKPGRPTDPDRLVNWPKGERVIVHFNWTIPAGYAGITNANGPFHVRGEELMIDKRRNSAPLPRSGFAFTGSIRRPGLADSNTMVYAADEFDPNTIGTYYNDIESVLDIPRQAPQGYVYDHQYPNPAYTFATNQMIEITLEPEYKDGKQRVTDLKLHIGRPAAKSPAPGKNVDKTNLVWTLTLPDGKPAVDDTGLRGVLGFFDKLTLDGRDPYVTLEFDDSLTLKTLHEVSRLLAAMDTDGGIRIEAPLPGHLYYKAFTPNESMRDPSKRIAQPWELRLALREGSAVGKLTLDDELYDGENDTWSKLKREYDVTSPADFRKALSLKRKDGGPLGPSGVFVFAPAEMTFGMLREHLPHNIEGRPTLLYHIFIEPPAEK